MSKSLTIVINIVIKIESYYAGKTNNVMEQGVQRNANKTRQRKFCENHRKQNFE